MPSKKWIEQAEELLTKRKPPLLPSYPSNEDRDKVAAALEAAYEKGKHDAFHPKGKVKQTAGWVSPDPKELQEFEEMLDRITEHRFGQDVDGDCPVRIFIWDRTRFEHPRWFLVPRDILDDDHHPYHPDHWKRENHTDEENMAYDRSIRDFKTWRMRMIQANLEAAADLIKTHFREAEYDIRKEDERKPNEVAARIKHLEYVKKRWTGDPDPFSFYEKKDGYTVDRKARTYSWVGKFGKGAGKTFTRPIEEKPADFDQLMLELERLKKWKYPEALDWSRVPKIPY